jgi:hypothetical protein
MLSALGNIIQKISDNTKAKTKNFINHDLDNSAANTEIPITEPDAPISGN